MRRLPVLLLIVAMPFASLPLAEAQAPTPAALPDSPVGQQLDWVLESLDDGARSLTPDDIRDRFAPEFVDAIPPEQAVALVQGFAAAFGPFAFEGFTRPPTTTQANALLSGAGGVPVVVPVAVEEASPHRITGMNFASAPPPPGVRIEPLLGDGATPASGDERVDGLFTVGDRQLYLSCVGSGSPTVILESGANDPAAPWFAIERAVAPSTRICSYDRANTVGGASDSAPTPRTVGDSVGDLHTLLQEANVPGPYVLVGHSIGGLIARLYASTYPDEVAGLVLVDASHEEQEARLEALVSPGLWAAYDELSGQIFNAEGIDFDASFAEVREARAAAPLRPMPLVVVSAGAADDPSLIPSFLPPGWPVEAAAQLWRELQADLARLTPHGRHVIAEQSGHYVHQSEPGLVVEAIEDVVDAVRDPASWEAAALASPVAGGSPSLDSVLRGGLDRGLTGLALHIERGDDVMFDGAAGLASIETETPLVPSDRFRIYSITKTFTAILILQLVDEGVLSLDDTVTKWLDTPEVRAIPNVDRITLRQLLTHTSGVYDYFDPDSPFWQDAYLGEGADWSRVWTPSELLEYADAANHAAYFDPGEGAHYSNTGYVLLGLIVEEATGQQFAERLHDTILDPLDLRDTFFAAVEPVPGGVVDGYHLLDGTLVNVSATHLSAQWAEGGIVSTTRDLARFADAVFRGELLEPDSIQEMFTFVPAEKPGIEWGMGVARMQTAAGELIGMAGDGPGFAARMFRLPTQDLTVVLLTNTGRDDDSATVVLEDAIRAALESAPVAK